MNKKEKNITNKRKILINALIDGENSGFIKNFNPDEALIEIHKEYFESKNKSKT